jgi:hypothetical protein
MYRGDSRAEGQHVSPPDDANGGTMGVFDKVVKDAEEAMARDDPGLAQQAGQAGQGMEAAQNLIGKQRGAHEHDQNQDRDQDQGSDQGGDDPDDNDEDW